MLGMLKGLTLGGGESAKPKKSLGSGGTVGVATRAVNIQRTMPRLMTTYRNGVQYDVLEGTDLLATVSTTTADPGDVLFEQLLNPSAFGSTRLAQFAPLYQRYRFEKLEVFYEPTQPSTAAGQLLGFSDYDPTVQLLPSDPQNLPRGAAHQGQAINQVWEPAVYSMAAAPTYTDLYTDTTGEDARLTYQGVFYLLAATALGNLGALGNLYVSYRVLFSIPQLDQGASTNAQESAAAYVVATGTGIQSDKPFYATPSKVFDQLDVTFPDATNHREVQFRVNPGWKVRIALAFDNGASTGTYVSWNLSSNQITFGSPQLYVSASGSQYWCVAAGTSVVSTTAYATVTIYPTVSSPSSGTTGAGVALSILHWNPNTALARRRKTPLDNRMEQLETMMAAIADGRCLAGEPRALGVCPAACPRACATGNTDIEDLCPARLGSSDSESVDPSSTDRAGVAPRRPARNLATPRGGSYKFLG